MANDRRLKRILYLLCAIYIITLGYGFYRNAQLQDNNALAMGLVACVTPLIVPCVFRLFHWRRVYELEIANVCFVYFASLIGSCFHGYSVLGFDKVVHFASGLLFTIVAALVYMIIKKSDRFVQREDYHLFLVFINALNLAIAVCWEFYEYAMLIFFDNDCINHYTQGVHDSITDMLCAACGGILITLCFIHAKHQRHPNFISNLCHKFYRYNMKEGKNEESDALG